jgi:protein gp37
MSDNSKIEWTDASWNPLRARNLETNKVGWHCERVSAGCGQGYGQGQKGGCYAEQINKGFFQLGTGLKYDRDARDKVEIFTDNEVLLEPLHWRKPRQIFVCSMTDLFGVFYSDEQIDRVFGVMLLCPRHTFQVLTKRPERMQEYLSNPDLKYRLSAALGDMLDGDWIWNEGKRFRAAIERMITACLGEYPDDEEGEERPYPDDPLPAKNIWLGTSVEDQDTANKRIHWLLRTPAAVHFVSYEPALGPVDFNDIKCIGVGFMSALSGEYYGTDEIDGAIDGLDWIICGGESGPHARPMHPDWARSVRDQCQAAKVAFFFKQWGEWKPISEMEETESDALYISNVKADEDRQNQSDLDDVYGQTCKVDTSVIGYGGAIGLEKGFVVVDGHPGMSVFRVGKKTAGRELDGRTWDEFPEGD